MVARAISSEVLQELVFIKQAKGNSSWKLTREVSDEIWLRKSHSSCKMRNWLEESAIQKNSQGLLEAIWERENESPKKWQRLCGWNLPLSHSPKLHICSLKVFFYSITHPRIHSLIQLIFCSFYKHWGYCSKQNKVCCLSSTISPHLMKCLLQYLVIEDNFLFLAPKGKHDFWWHFKH